MMEVVTTVPRSKNPSLKDEELYEDLREQGNSKEKAARISNAAAARGRSAVGKKGGQSGSYQDWTVRDLRKRAKQLGLSGYSQEKEERAHHTHPETLSKQLG